MCVCVRVHRDGLEDLLTAKHLSLCVSVLCWCVLGLCGSHVFHIDRRQEIFMRLRTGVCTHIIAHATTSHPHTHIHSPTLLHPHPHPHPPTRPHTHIQTPTPAPTQTTHTVSTMRRISKIAGGAKDAIEDAIIGGPPLNIPAPVDVALFRGEREPGDEGGVDTHKHKHSHRQTHTRTHTLTHTLTHAHTRTRTHTVSTMRRISKIAGDAKDAIEDAIIGGPPPNIPPPVDVALFRGEREPGEEGEVGTMEAMMDAAKETIQDTKDAAKETLQDAKETLQDMGAALGYGNSSTDKEGGGEREGEGDYYRERGGEGLSDHEDKSEGRA